MTTKTTRIITLTGRAPVEIREAEYPLIASISQYERIYQDMTQQIQAEMAGRVRSYFLGVRRRHLDPPCDGDVVIVYGVASQGIKDSSSYRHGTLVKADTRITSCTIAHEVFAIAERCKIPREIADRCIAELPAETL